MVSSKEIVSRSAPARELAVVRSLAAVLEDSLAHGDVQTAADLADQIADHLRAMSARRAA